MIILHDIKIQNYVSLTNIIEFYILVSKSGNSVYEYITEIYKILIVPLSSISWSIVDTSSGNVVGPTADVPLTCSTSVDCWAKI